eukprot:COSAG01_NODE_60_length_29981_cov_23.262533_24_plen_180_part_00
MAPARWPPPEQDCCVRLDPEPWWWCGNPVIGASHQRARARARAPARARKAGAAHRRLEGRSGTYASAVWWAAAARPGPQAACGGGSTMLASQRSPATRRPRADMRGASQAEGAAGVLPVLPRASRRPIFTWVPATCIVSLAHRSWAGWRPGAGPCLALAAAGSGSCLAPACELGLYEYW